jgi:phosphohistidine phosphatase
MRLYIVQHAKAAGKEVEPERSLTDEGRDEAERMAFFIKGLGLSVGYLWHSGKKRAVETAEILSEAFHIENPMNARDGLGPNDDVERIEKEISSVEQDVIIVGHMPFLSRLASKLLCGAETAGMVTFKNAGIVCLRRDEENRWHVDWAVTPELVARRL